MRRLLLALGLVLVYAVPAAAAPSELPGWTPVACGCERAYTVDAVDASRVFLGTSSGVSRSDDGGWTWRSTPFPVTGEVRQLSFGDRSTGAAVGTFEGIVVTRDGGTTWRQLRPWAGRGLDVHVLSGQVLALAESGLFRSRDGGATWQRVPGPGPLDAWSTTDWSDARTGVVASGAAAWTTTDGGESWATSPVSAVYGFASLSTGPHQALVAGMRGVDDGRAFVGEVDGDGLRQLPLEPRTVANEQVRGLARFSSTRYAVGVEGLIARSTDFGASWVYEPPPPSFERSSLYDVDAIDADHAWAAVYAGRVLIRNATTTQDVTRVPHKELGIGLLGLAGLSAAGALGVLLAGRPTPLALVLAGVAAASGVAGVTAAVERQTCHPNGCDRVVSLREDGEALAPIPAGPPAPSSTPPPTASPSASPVPSVAARPTAAPSPSPVSNPTPPPPRSPRATLPSG